MKNSVKILFALVICVFFLSGCGEYPSKESTKEITNSTRIGVIEEVFDFGDSDIVIVKVKYSGVGVDYYQAIGFTKDSLQTGSIVRIFTSGESGLLVNTTKVYIARKK